MLLRQALDNSTADFRSGQWKAIEELLQERSHLLVVQQTGWCKSLVYPFVLNHLQQPKDVKSLAECLDVRLSQMQDWLNKAVNEGKVRKINRPVAYIINQPTTQLSLL